MAEYSGCKREYRLVYNRLLNCGAYLFVQQPEFCERNAYSYKDVNSNKNADKNGYINIHADQNSNSHKDGNFNGHAFAFLHRKSTNKIIWGKSKYFCSRSTVEYCSIR